MECTGHQSIEGVRNYKRTSDATAMSIKNLNSKPLEEDMAVASINPTTLTTTSVHQLKSPSDSNPHITILNGVI